MYVNDCLYSSPMISLSLCSCLLMCYRASINTLMRRLIEINGDQLCERQRVMCKVGRTLPKKKHKLVEWFAYF